MVVHFRSQNTTFRACRSCRVRKIRALVRWKIKLPEATSTELRDDRGEQVLGLPRRAGRDRQRVHRDHVLVQVLALVQVDRAGQVLDVDDVRQIRVAEPQQAERAAGGRVPAAGERQDLQRDVGPARHPDEVLQMRAQDRPAADRPAQYGFVDDGPQPGGPFVAGQDLLTRRAQRDEPLDLGVRQHPLAPAELYDGPRVVRGLQQPGHELDLVGADQLGGDLEPAVGVEPGRGQVVVPLPPARVVRLAGQVQQAFTLGRVVELVEGQQIVDVAHLEADPAELEPADLGLRAADRPAGVGAADVGVLAHPAEVGAEHDPQGGRAARRPLLRHCRLRFRAAPVGPCRPFWSLHRAPSVDHFTVARPVGKPGAHTGGTGAPTVGKLRPHHPVEPISARSSMPDATTAPRSVPVGVDTTRASIARVYDAALNGKDNFEIDREVLRQVATVAPQVNDLAWSNRNFLIRACRFLAGQAGITQYLDCGSGLPTAENTHQVVQRLQPTAKVLYVDNDPVVLAHGRALLEENDRTLFISADIFRPEEVLGNEEVREFLDFGKPIALIHNGTLHHYLGDDGPGIIKKYTDAMVPGSYTVIAHFFDPQTPDHSKIARAMEQKFNHSLMGSGAFRTYDQIKAMFGDQELVEPGLVRCDDWWPDGPRVKPLNQVEECIAGAVGRKV